MLRYEFDLSISAERVLAYYQGHVEHVIATTAQGVRVQFPARLLRGVMMADGVYGRFELTCDARHQNAQLRRISA